MPANTEIVRQTQHIRTRSGYSAVLTVSIPKVTSKVSSMDESVRMLLSQVKYGVVCAATSLSCTSSKVSNFLVGCASFSFNFVSSPASRREFPLALVGEGVYEI